MPPPVVDVNVEEGRCVNTDIGRALFNLLRNCLPPGVRVTVLSQWRDQLMQERERRDSKQYGAKKLKYLEERIRAAEEKEEEKNGKVAAARGAVRAHRARAVIGCVLLGLCVAVKGKASTSEDDSEDSSAGKGVTTKVTLEPSRIVFAVSMVHVANCIANGFHNKLHGVGVKDAPSCKEEPACPVPKVGDRAIRVDGSTLWSFLPLGYSEREWAALSTIAKVRSGGEVGLGGAGEGLTCCTASATLPTSSRCCSRRRRCGTYSVAPLDAS